MQLRIAPATKRGAFRAAAIIPACAAIVLLRRPLLHVGALALGAAALCFLVAPLAGLFERRFPRPASALLALASVGITLGALVWLLLPALLHELAELGRTLPQTLRAATEWLAGARDWLLGHLPGLSLPEFDFTALGGALPGLAGGTISLAVNLADVLGRLSLAVVLAYFFLRDRDALLLRLELLLPRSVRATAVRMGSAVCRELRLYLQGQLMIAGAVSLLSIAALLMIGVRSALVLGLLIGILNMIPYFGPYIGGAPAVLIALMDSWQKSALTLAALVIVQQLDGALISPRVMGSLTGFPPALVLVGIYGGARIGGVAGMLLALPAMMATRTLVRVFVQKCENI